MSTLGYLGPPGTYSEEAALRYRPDAELVPFPSEAAVAAAVEAGDVDEGVLAIENSLEGSVTRSVDAIIERRVSIRHELVLPIEHCLIARPGTAIDDITEIHAHPQALAQCREFIERRWPQAVQQAALSNAEAVREIMTAVARGAAIAGARAAEIYGGAILERGIQDNPHNKTRFAVLGPTDGPATGRDKTSIAFAVAHDRPGTLLGVLQELAGREINLTKIESRPSREELGIYVFQVDLEGHRTDPPVAEALAAVEAQSSFFRLLGSYPRGDDA